MRNFFKLATIFFLFILAFSCSTGSRNDQPPNIRFGADPCDECRMIINEARYAAAIVTTDEQVHLFDDIGCMVNYLKKHSEPVARYWVVDFNSENWLNATKAVFVKNKDFPTPMGYGIVAFSDTTTAENFIRLHRGEQLKFSELRKQVFETSRVPG